MSKVLPPAMPVKSIGAPVVGAEEAAPFIERWLATQRSLLLSPIEVVFALAMLHAHDDAGPFLRATFDDAPPVRATEAHGKHIAYGRAGSLFAQREVDLGRRVIRVDFALFVDARFIAIELDGHEFHASKARRSADADRDLALTKRGWTPVRFTGSDVWRDADGCVAKVLDLVGFKAKRVDRLRPAEVEQVTTPALSTDEKFARDKAGAESVLRALGGETKESDASVTPQGRFSR